MMARRELRPTIFALVEVDVTRCPHGLDFLYGVVLALRLSVPIVACVLLVHTVSSHWPALNVISGWIDMFAGVEWAWLKLVVVSCLAC
jgi:hypothetical protein